MTTVCSLELRLLQGGFSDGVSGLGFVLYGERYPVDVKVCPEVVGVGRMEGGSKKVSCVCFLLLRPVFSGGSFLGLWTLAVDLSYVVLREFQSSSLWAMG